MRLVPGRKTRNTHDAIRATQYAFSLVELMIVVAIIGILAAITLPKIQDHITHAKEATAKDNLRVLREAIEMYAAQHNGLAPGRFSDPAVSPTPLVIIRQLTDKTNINGLPTPPADLGPYLKTIPRNPFNDNNLIYIVSGPDFPAGPIPNFGWLYLPATGKIKLNHPGSDSKNTPYVNY